jgi:protein-tyrosine phosphatase
MTDRIAVLFVCLGNICRSPLAEAAFRAAAERRGMSVETDSAGIGAWHIGEQPDSRARQIAADHGIDISGCRARQVGAADFGRFSHVVALDHDNLASLERLRPAGARADLSLLLDHVAGREGEAVTDPYYGGREGFVAAWADVTAGAEALLAKISGDQ